MLFVKVQGSADNISISLHFASILKSTLVAGGKEANRSIMAPSYVMTGGAPA